jgi:PHD/YefM family antitoxin component YafN of YafNO toxin-antitoxin module
MFTHSYRASSPAASYVFRFALIALVLATACAVSFAQGVGSTRDLSSMTGGNNSIRGRVYTPTGDPAAHMTVRLESTDMISKQATTDADGVFIFSGLTAGNFTLTVEGGKEYDNSVEYPQIYKETGSAGARNLELAIQLRFKPENNPALAGVPKEAVQYYAKGVESAKKGDSKKAVESLSQAVALYPNFGLALSELGVQYLRMGQPDKAAEALQKAVKLAPTDFSVHLNYGIALLNKKNFAEAETELRQALTINKELPTAHMYLGVALLTLSRDEKTKQYDMAKYNEAQQELELAASSGKAEVAMAHKYLGGIYMGNKDYKRAADELELYLKLSPKAPDAERLKTIIKDLRSK